MCFFSIQPFLVDIYINIQPSSPHGHAHVLHVCQVTPSTPRVTPHPPRALTFATAFALFAIASEYSSLINDHGYACRHVRKAVIVDPERIVVILPLRTRPALGRAFDWRFRDQCELGLR